MSRITRGHLCSSAKNTLYIKGSLQLPILTHNVCVVPEKSDNNLAVTLSRFGRGAVCVNCVYLIVSQWTTPGLGGKKRNITGANIRKKEQISPSDKVVYCLFWSPVSFLLILAVMKILFSLFIPLWIFILAQISVKVCVCAHRYLCVPALCINYVRLLVWTQSFHSHQSLQWLQGPI